MEPRAGVYGYYDASHADDIDTKRSTIGYLFFFEGCVLVWSSKLHTYITTSTNHSEYCAAAKAARMAKFLETIFIAIGQRAAVRPIVQRQPWRHRHELQPCSPLCNRHVDLADHYAREQVERQTITVSYVKTDAMIADIFTKALSPAKFTKFSEELVSKTDFNA